MKRLITQLALLIAVLCASVLGMKVGSGLRRAEMSDALPHGIIGYMPPVEELKNPKDRFASVVYTADGIEMGRYFRSMGNRVYADYDEISQHVVDALVATEDARFEDHSGIDFRGLFRAIVKTVIMRDKSAGGGSTITQQLAKLLYAPPSDGQLERAIERRNTVFVQMEKAGLITEEQRDSLSRLPLGLDFHRIDHNDGIAPYFREELRRYLTAKKPERDNYPKWDQQRFVDDSIAWVTNPLYGWIAKNPKADGSYYDIYADGLRIYTTIDSRMQRYAEEAVHEHMSDLQRRFDREKKGMPYTSNPNELSAAGRDKLIRNAMRQSERYRIAKLAGLSDAEIEKQFNTPVEMTLFSYDGPVDKTMTPRDSILYVKTFLRTGFMSMDPRNGHVKAYVGGPEFRFFQYDMVSTGRRQVGSTIKPFLYTLAMESGFSPCSTFLNAQPTYTDAAGNVWSPRNSGHSRIGEMVDLRWALTNSNNWISARLINEVGPSRLVNLMHNLGITNRLQAVMSLALGPCEVSVREMVAAYSAFANKGMRVDPIYVTAITDNNGNVLAKFSPNQTEVISDVAYYRILSILLNVVDSGTGNRLRRTPYSLTAQIGGKTGTTNFNADGWFMGFTPELVSGVWVGGDERYIHFNSMVDGQGAEMALPIYGKYMRKIFDDRTLPYSQNTTFAFPPGISLCDGFEEAESEVEETIVEGAFD